MRVLREQKYDDLTFLNHLQDSSGKEKQLSSPEQRKRARLPQGSKNVSRDASPGCLEIEVLSKQLSEIYEGHNIKAIQDSRESYGFAISSGWSSTFFPYGMNDESNNDCKISIAEYSV